MVVGRMRMGKGRRYRNEMLRCVGRRHERVSRCELVGQSFHCFALLLVANFAVQSFIIHQSLPSKHTKILACFSSRVTFHFIFCLMHWLGSKKQSHNKQTKITKQRLPPPPSSPAARAENNTKFKNHNLSHPISQTSYLYTPHPTANPPFSFLSSSIHPITPGASPPPAPPAPSPRARDRRARWRIRGSGTPAPTRTRSAAP